MAIVLEIAAVGLLAYLAISRMKRLPSRCAMRSDRATRRPNVSRYNGALSAGR
jgi:hypothetical protein